MEGRLFSLRGMDPIQGRQLSIVFAFGLSEKGATLKGKNLLPWGLH